MKQLKVAITGGMGSGKSYVCQLLAERGIDVYDCDAAAKRLMRTSASLRQQLKALVGDEVYCGNRLVKPVMAQFLLASDENHQAVNHVVHPAVADDFVQSGLQWMECAILFESGFDKLVDRVVCVTAPEEVRLRRIMSRDGISRSRASEWLALQLPQEEVLAKSDYEIVNDGERELNAQIDHIINLVNNKNK
ncbi:MAG: dephospho-CoA kinase [Prevotella sp.]|nr:dephospho-CoA kinase [Prevotella sp.]